MQTQELAQYFDHTLLKPNATKAQIKTLCDEAIAHQFKGVCINSNWLPDVVEALRGNKEVLPVAVVGFPLGAMARPALRDETRFCVDAGAREVDMVINVGRFLDGNADWLRKDVATVCDAAGKNCGVKVILETGYLSAEQIALATKISIEEGARFVKTSTGFGPRGASIEDIQVMHRTIEECGASGDVGIKASGGIRDLAFATELIKAGATRIGASASVHILNELA